MRLKILSVLILIAALAAIAGYMLRKELPYQFDIIQTGDGIAIVSHDTWNQRPLRVKVTQNGRPITTGIISPSNHSEVLHQLPATSDLVVTISRQDLVGIVRYKAKTVTIKPSASKQAYVVLVGASIGKAWHLQEFGRRAGEKSVIFSSRAHYAFDKTDTLTPLLNLKMKPDAVILKECSDYFPRDFEQSTAKLNQWVEQLKQSGIQAILATTVPVADMGPIKDKQPAIDQWNDYVRRLSRQKNIPLLDLAAALQTSASDTYLTKDYSQADGFHLTPAAYAQVLDPLLKNFAKEHLQSTELTSKN